MTDPKGIIVSHTIERAGTNLSISGGIDPAILKKHLLYWDSIVYPIVNGFGPNLNVLPDLAYLESEGILRLENVTINPVGIIPGCTNENNVVPMQFMPDLLAYGQIQLAKEKLTREEIWNIAQVGEALSFSSQNNNNKIIFELRLLEGLPVPDPDVSFDDVVNFRISHANELNNLRKALENFRTKIIESSEPERTLVILKQELYDSILNIESSLRKHKIKHFFDALSVYLNVSTNQLATMSLGAFFAHYAGMPRDLGAIAGMGFNAILKSVEREVRGAGMLPKEINDYMYLYTAKKHRIIK
ncbi:DUF6236 family protein [Acidihalobacter ferrooxydans]|uniref:DUF6236 family protein n=1 Tax=Acidihalobacter ferrooxydans TaxID=1765967 RepID=UPI0012EB3E57|nr:DUF6236 family protein [Acidihalobacter ferrooxydans]